MDQDLDKCWAVIGWDWFPDSHRHTAETHCLPLFLLLFEGLWSGTRSLRLGLQHIDTALAVAGALVRWNLQNLAMQ